ncbi:phosphate ABC transporter permease PstA [Photobacterium halotolerans]|uniref:Phosphate transport system permease protein PstA n=1 Tax=Photobacterium halotolerans TaxID=265726 RepID=A0A7X4WTN2_9GAMM|nr:phosphate ABC transporter permease PstA [Photobacterium halotolerans]NAW66594.1 phosphate ABC transporter permease PstA [Photobacterium halotolerans]NAW87266.1 phosphate ABC transporter permease PstA [Photobacterium halotolerans]NAX48860.1 phosphate ABC transporter permease PstA [Photobacterium halotolerans]
MNQVLTLNDIVGRNKRTDFIIAGIGIAILLIAMSLLVSVFIDLLYSGWPRLFDASFYTNFPSRHPERAGILSAWVGTSLVMLVTAAIAIPFGVAAGLYLEEYAPKNWLTNIIEINVSNLAGVPSIIYGLLALGLFIYGFGLGESILTAGLVLALLILPVIIVATRESIRSIPQELREAAYGLGADQWQTVRLYVLPAARPGILTGTIVGLARAIGEAAPVITIGALTFIAFLPESPFQAEPPFINFDWLSSPFTLMPIQLFNWVSRPQADFHINAAATGVVLMAMTILMNGIAIYIRYRLRRNMK